MKTVAINSIKGGTGKSTLSILLVNALAGASYKVLVLDTDASNNSLSFHFSEGIAYETVQERNIFNVFLGGPTSSVAENAIAVTDHIDLIHGDVRLNEFRSTDSIKRLKRALQSLAYDFCIIDTAPTYDNIVGNVLTASDVLLVPVQQDVFSYQALRYQFEKLADLELDTLDTHIVFNQFEAPRTENQSTYRNQITNMLLEDEVFKPFINPNRISRSSVYRKYINRQNYRIDEKADTQKCFGEVKGLVQSVFGVIIKEAV
ncbi:chromosome partitioning protein ParA [Spirochaetia bacterium]|nr:chromosome partitioning protein ParA [Spirochaetia bacterium]